MLVGTFLHNLASQGLYTSANKDPGLRGWFLQSIVNKSFAKSGTTNKRDRRTLCGPIRGWDGEICESYKIMIAQK